MINEEFTKELEDLINRHGVDNELNTPDYILAEYITSNLADMRVLVAHRDKWFGFTPFENSIGVAVDADMVDHVQSLVADVEVDLDAPLDNDIDEYEERND